MLFHWKTANVSSVWFRRRKPLGERGASVNEVATASPSQIVTFFDFSATFFASDTRELYGPPIFFASSVPSSHRQLEVYSPAHILVLSRQTTGLWRARSSHVGLISALCCRVYLALASLLSLSLRIPENYLTAHPDDKKNNARPLLQSRPHCMRWHENCHQWRPWGNNH